MRGRNGVIRRWVPRWWRGEGGLLGRILDQALWPAETLFRAGVTVRNSVYDRGLLRVERAPVPVVSVGNLGIGGSGKTPIAAWVAARLAAWGHRPAIVLRGYGADEILVHRELNPAVPVHAASRRVEAVQAAAAAGCDIAVVDDGFQHRGLDRQLELVLVAADGWEVNLRLLPRGPWREGFGALRRADLVLVTRKEADDAEVARLEAAVAAVVGRERIVRCRIAPGDLQAVGGRAGEGGMNRTSLDSLSGRRILAVASLADPRPFVSHLEAVGAEVELRSFPDHHEFDAAEVAELLTGRGERPLVMTRKEAVKLRPLIPEHVEAWMLEQRVEIESGGAALDEALGRVVRA